MRVSLFCCPVCGGTLQEEQGALRCEKRHSFDLAKEGYAHLLPANRMHSKLPGDDKQMVAARRRFLDGGWYEPFADALCDAAKQELAPFMDKKPVLLDVGCGEGYYTGRLAQALPGVQTAGFDISKAAVRAAAKRYTDVEFAVASSFAIPMREGSVSCITNIFSPAVPAEFARLLAPGAAMIYAVPGPRHLWGMKEVLYDNPYENQTKETAYPGFILEKRIPVQTVIHLPDKEAIADLFSMTPYYWNTPRSGAQRLAERSSLSTEIAFDFLVYRRINE